MPELNTQYIADMPGNALNQFLNMKKMVGTQRLMPGAMSGDASSLNQLMAINPDAGMQVAQMHLQNAQFQRQSELQQQQLQQQKVSDLMKLYEESRVSPWEQKMSPVDLSKVAAAIQSGKPEDLAGAFNPQPSAQNQGAPQQSGKDPMVDYIIRNGPIPETSIPLKVQQQRVYSAALQDPSIRNNPNVLAVLKDLEANKQLGTDVQGKPIIGPERQIFGPGGEFEQFDKSKGRTAPAAESGDASTPYRTVGETKYTPEQNKSLTVAGGALRSKDILENTQPPSDIDWFKLEAIPMEHWNNPIAGIPDSSRRYALAALAFTQQANREEFSRMPTDDQRWNLMQQYIERGGDPKQAEQARNNRNDVVNSAIVSSGRKDEESVRNELKMPLGPDKGGYQRLGPTQIIYKGKTHTGTKDQIDAFEKAIKGK